MGTAGFDRDEDHWPKRWAEAYVAFAAGEKRDWLRAMGHRIFPVVGWAERGGYDAMGHGNSVPRFHVTWGTGPGIVEPFERRAREAQTSGRLTFRFRHRVDALVDDERRSRRRQRRDPRTRHASSAARARRARSSAISRLRAQAVIVASGGIGGNHDLVRQNWPKRLGEPPKHMISGVPEHVDGRMIGITEAAGARLINRDRMWHYVEGIRNWNPIWPRHGIRILPGPSSMWFDATGKRLPAPLFPGSDTLGQLHYIMAHRLRLFLVHPDPEHHQEGIRALRLRAEPRPHRQELAHDHQARHQQGRAGAGGSVQEEGRRLHRARQSRRPGQRDERAGRRQSAQARPHQGARSRRATARSPIPTSRTRR